MTKITKKLFKVALESSTGTQRDLSKRLSVSDAAIHFYIERHPDMKALMDKRRMDNVDKAEDEIFNQLEFEDYDNQQGSAKIRQKAAELILKSLGKKRGWVEKTEVEHLGEPIKIETIIPKEVTELLKEVKNEENQS